MSAKSPREEPQRQRAVALALLLLALLAAFVAAWPLLGEPGFLNTRGGGDSPFLLQRLQQLSAALGDGHFPARWMPDANYGYGYPFFNYYAPLSIYIAAVFRQLGFPIVRSAELAQLAGFIAAAWGMFLLARRWFKSAWAGFLASVAYTAAPFHLVNIYVRGDSLAEFWAMAWYPWLLLAVDGLFDYRGDRFPFGRAAALALAYAALILSHNISALIFSPFLLLYCLLRGFNLFSRDRTVGEDEPQGSRAHFWPALVAALLLGLALAAWFFVPALAEQDLAQLGPVTSGYFHYSNHFRGLDLVQTSPLFDYSVAGGRAFRMGLVQALLALLGALVLVVVGWRRKRIALPAILFILLALLVSTLMITPLSRLLWDHLPLLPFTQFPWRFLSVQAFAAALATAALALLPWRQFLVPAAAVLLLSGSMMGLRTDSILLGDEDVTPWRLAQYEWFTGNIGSTVSAEYLPTSVQPRPYSSAWLVQGSRPGGRALQGDLLTAKLLEARTGRQRWQVAGGDSGVSLILPTLYWPGWQAAIDGEAVEIAPAPGSSLILVEVPGGQHMLDLRLGRTPVRLAAELLSLVALFLAAYALLKDRSELRLTRSSWYVLGLILLGLLLLRFWPQPALSAGNMTWDFAQLGYLHHDETGVPFDDGMILQHYEYSRDELAPGESFTLSLHFSGASGQEVEAVLGTPALAWPSVDPEPPAVARQIATAEGDLVRFEFTLAETAPAGPVMPRITVAGARPLTPSGKTRGPLFLRPLQIAADRPSQSASLALDASAVQVRPRDEEALEVQLVWSTQTPLSHNYNLSLRLMDESGQWLAALDTQPGYGFLPSSAWPVGEAVYDWLAMPYPADFGSAAVMPLVLRLYEVESGEVVLTRRLGELSLQEGQLMFNENEPLLAAPEGIEPLPITFGDGIALLGYRIDQDESDLSLTLYWQALTGGQPDYTRFVHLFDPQTGEIVAQRDGHPWQDSYPTSQWIEGEVVIDRIAFDLAEMPPNDYRLGFGFYRQEGDSLLHLTAVDGQTELPLPSNRAELPDPVPWTPAGE